MKACSFTSIFQAYKMKKKKEKELERVLRQNLYWIEYYLSLYLFDNGIF